MMSASLLAIGFSCHGALSPEFCSSCELLISVESESISLSTQDMDTGIHSGRSISLVLSFSCAGVKMDVGAGSDVGDASVCLLPPQCSFRFQSFLSFLFAPF